MSKILTFPEFLEELAKEARVSDRPWEAFEYDFDGDQNSWEPIHSGLSLFSIRDKFFRREPNTITVNGIEVPEPEREELRDGQAYNVPDLVIPKYFLNCVWRGTGTDMIRLERGLIHLPKENAIAHTKSMLARNYAPKDIKPSK